MRIFSLRSGIVSPRSLPEVFAFFAEARNLEALTPDWLQVEVLTPSPITMVKGLKIDYRLRLRRMPIRWQSEITRWEPPYQFVDEQRRGPFRIFVGDVGAACWDIPLELLYDPSTASQLPFISPPLSSHLWGNCKLQSPIGLRSFGSISSWISSCISSLE